MLPGSAYVLAALQLSTAKPVIKHWEDNKEVKYLHSVTSGAVRYLEEAGLTELPGWPEEK